MGKAIQLPGRDDPFAFAHRPSQVNYGGKVHFHQAAFPPQERGHLEEAGHRALGRFLDIIQAHPDSESLPQVLKTIHRPVFAEETESLPPIAAWLAEISDVFFDQRLETPQLSPAVFKDWVVKDLAAVAKIYTGLRANALAQEHASRVARLNYFMALAIVSLLAELAANYFDQQIALPSRLAMAARLAWGRALAWALRTAELGNPLQRLRAEHLGNAQPDAACLRLLTPHILVYGDAADAIHVEESLLRVNPYKITGGLRGGLTEILLDLLGRNKNYQCDDLKRALAEPAALAAVMESPAGQKHVARSLRRNRELRMQLVAENALNRTRQFFRTYLLEHPSPEVWANLANDRNLNELVTKKSARRRLVKALRKLRQPWEELADLLAAESQGLVQSRRKWFWRLPRRQLLAEAGEAVQRLARFLAEAEDFRILRAHYSRESRREGDWQGIKLWRAFEITVHDQGKSDLERLALAPVWNRRQADMENSFAEGNLFLCTAEGEIYPLEDQRRGQVVFMFADLRNSTETTMKLTKDTASYLAPYLTTVNSSARDCHGERIYFAGDGFAAYFRKITDAIRAGYILASRFQELQELSTEQFRQKAREIYQRAAALGLPLQRPTRLAQALAGMDKRGLGEELLDFLLSITRQTGDQIPEPTLRAVLAKTAAAYSMPRVEIGMALTMGELFFAMVGEEGEEKIPIVISPQLTQAARLSGSSDIVKNHIESHFPQPFRYNVYTWDKKLYNRGIVITEHLFRQLEQELQVRALDAGGKPGEELRYYFDHPLNRRVILRKNQEPVLLKGIAEPCTVYEVALPGSCLDQQYGPADQAPATSTRRSNE